MKLTEREIQILKLERMLAVQFRRFKQEINALHGDKLTGHEYMVLRILSQNQPQMMSQLAKDFGVTASYATMVVDKLLQKGYVNRERSKKDRRIVELTVLKAENRF
ncbi:MarR family transcriptional regulator [Terrilactibacillus sp. S3-3]|nr:MarR family transcriptional regulator [Terrilactibacillus sp. S3-3]